MLADTITRVNHRLTPIKVWGCGVQITCSVAVLNESIAVGVAWPRPSTHSITITGKCGVILLTCTQLLRDSRVLLT